MLNLVLPMPDIAGITVQHLCTKEDSTALAPVALNPRKACHSKIPCKSVDNNLSVSRSPCSLPKTRSPEAFSKAEASKKTEPVTRSPSFSKSTVSKSVHTLDKNNIVPRKCLSIPLKNCKTPNCVRTSSLSSVNRRSKNVNNNNNNNNVVNMTTNSVSNNFKDVSFTHKKSHSYNKPVFYSKSASACTDKSDSKCSVRNFKQSVDSKQNPDNNFSIKRTGCDSTKRDRKNLIRNHSSAIKSRLSDLHSSKSRNTLFKQQQARKAEQRISQNVTSLHQRNMKSGNSDSKSVFEKSLDQIERAKQSTCPKVPRINILKVEDAGPVYRLKQIPQVMISQEEESRKKKLDSIVSVHQPEALLVKVNTRIRRKCNKKKTEQKLVESLPQYYTGITTSRRMVRYIQSLTRTALKAFVNNNKQPASSEQIAAISSLVAINQLLPNNIDKNDSSYNRIKEEESETCPVDLEDEEDYAYSTVSSRMYGW